MRWTPRPAPRTVARSGARSSCGTHCSRSMRPTSLRESLARQAGFSFDRAGLRAVRAASRERRAAPTVFGSGPLPDRDRDELVSLSDLVHFYNHPIRALIYDRAGLWITRPDATPDEQIPVSLSGLEAWSIGERLLRLRLSGHELEP